MACFELSRSFLLLALEFNVPPFEQGALEKFRDAETRLWHKLAYALDLPLERQWPISTPQCECVSTTSVTATSSPKRNRIKQKILNDIRLNEPYKMSINYNDTMPLCNGSDQSSNVRPGRATNDHASRDFASTPHQTSSPVTHLWAPLRES